MFSEVNRVPLNCGSCSSRSNKEAAPLDWARLISYIPRNTHTFMTPLSSLAAGPRRRRSKVSKQCRDARFQNAVRVDFVDIPCCSAGVRYRKPRAECSSSRVGGSTVSFPSSRSNLCSGILDRLPNGDSTAARLRLALSQQWTEE